MKVRHVAVIVAGGAVIAFAIALYVQLAGDRPTEPSPRDAASAPSHDASARALHDAGAPADAGADAGSDLRIHAGPDGASKVASSVVSHQIRSTYQAGIQRCFKAAHKRDPAARATIAMTFTVDELGNVQAPSATGAGPAVDACVTKLMQRWRFQVPKDPDGNPTSASFNVTLDIPP